MATTSPTTIYPVAGPLTTPFVPPSFCTSAIGYELGVTCNSGGSVVRASACFPNSLSFSDLGSISQIYSPAIACPVGWTSNTQSLSTVTCCPSSFFASGGSCIGRTMLTGGYNDFYSCSSSSPLSVYFTPSSSFTISSAFIYAVQIRLIVDPTATCTSFTGSTISSSASSSARPAASSSTTITTGLPSAPDSGSEPKKLSGGVIAGIVIGVLAFFLLVVSAIFLLLRRRKQQQHAGNSMSHSGSHSGGDLPEFVASYTKAAAQHSAYKIPAPVTTEKTKTPSLRTAVSPVPTTPTQMDTAELFFPTHTTHRTSDVSELTNPPQQAYPQSHRDTYTTTSSSPYARSPLSELATFEQPHQSTTSHNVSPVYASTSTGQEPTNQPLDRDSQVAKLEAEKEMLVKLRTRQLAQIEQEQANLQAELERLRGVK